MKKFGSALLQPARSVCVSLRTFFIIIIIKPGAACRRCYCCWCTDPYVKVLLLYNGQCVGKKKTQVKKKTLNPTFNESFVFDLPAAACCTPVSAGSGGAGVGHLLRGVRLQFVVYDWDRVTRNEVIGRLELGDDVRAGADAAAAAQRHWNDVVNSPRKQVAEWHRLQP